MPSSRHRGWFWDQTNTELEVYVDSSTREAAFGQNTGLTVDRGGLTVTAGGLTVTAGGLTVTAGGLTVTAGNLTVTAADVEMTAGTLALNDGGTVTQATNKSTGVTLNTHTGQITMDNAQLTAGSEVTFTVTNSVVEATDIVLVHHGSAGTSGSYLVQCTAVASGSFDVTVTNASGGNLSEAIVVHFAVLHGASS